MAEKIKILLDTNFLLTIVRYKIHGLEEIKQKLPAEFYTLSRILFELAGLGKSDKKVKKEVSIVEQMLRNNNVKVLDSTIENVDNELIGLSKEYVIATNDKELRRRVREAGGKTIYVKSLTYVEVEELLEQ
ncbi:MAG: hypothetical protein WCI04_02035 [archaeon]